jgi:hypothetical protein
MFLSVGVKRVTGSKCYGSGIKERPRLIEYSPLDTVHRKQEMSRPLVLSSVDDHQLNTQAGMPSHQQGLYLDTRPSHRQYH